QLEWLDDRLDLLHPPRPGTLVTGGRRPGPGARRCSRVPAWARPCGQGGASGLFAAIDQCGPGAHKVGADRPIPAHWRQTRLFAAFRVADVGLDAPAPRLEATKCSERPKSCQFRQTELSRGATWLITFAAKRAPQAPPREG